MSVPFLPRLSPHLLTGCFQAHEASRFSPQLALGVLTSNKKGGSDLQDWAGAKGRAVWGAAFCGLGLFEVLVAARAHLFKIDGRVLGGMQYGGAGAGAVLGVTVHACFFHLVGRVHGGMQFGVLVLVVF